MRLLSLPAWMRPAPDSLVARSVAKGKSPWVDAVHLLWTAWLFITPVFDRDAWNLRWVMLTLGLTLGGVSLTPLRVLAMLAAGAFGVLPFCALGMFVGTLIKGQGAPGLLNLVYLPMAFLSGLWLPLSMLPKFLQSLAPLWPSYHLNQLALAAVGMNTAPRLPHMLALAAFAAVFMALATRRLRRLG